MDPSAKPHRPTAYSDTGTYDDDGDIESYRHEFRVTYGSDNYASAITHIHYDGSEHPTSGAYDTVTYACDACSAFFKYFGSNLFLR